MKIAGVDDLPVGLEVTQCRLVSVDEQGLSEKAVPGFLSGYRYLEAVCRISAGKAVESKEFILLTQIGHSLRLESGKVIRGDGTIDISPSDGVMNGGGVFKKFIVGASTGALTGIDI